MRTPWILAVALSLPLAAPVWAQTAQDQVIKELTQLGYRHFTVSRTWLGRVRVVARGKPGTREIVLNPSTGVVLRDYTDRRKAADKPRRAKRSEDHRARDDRDRPTRPARSEDKPHAGAGGAVGDPSDDDWGYGNDSSVGPQADWDDIDVAPPSDDTWDEVVEDAASDDFSDRDVEDAFSDDIDDIEDISMDVDDSHSESGTFDGDDGRGPEDDRERDDPDDRDQGADRGTEGAPEDTSGY
jgi:hypothetical protein